MGKRSRKSGNIKMGIDMMKINWVYVIYAILSIIIVWIVYCYMTKLMNIENFESNAEYIDNVLIESVETENPYTKATQATHTKQTCKCDCICDCRKNKKAGEKCGCGDVCHCNQGGDKLLSFQQLVNSYEKPYNKHNSGYENAEPYTLPPEVPIKSYEQYNFHSKEGPDEKKVYSYNDFSGMVA